MPTKEILEKYANILINFALNGGRGIKKGEVVFLQVPESAKPILLVLRDTVLKAGAYPITHYLPDDYTRGFFEIANDDQVKFFPARLLKGRVDEMDHYVGIIAETNKYELKGIDPKKIMTSSLSMKPYRDWMDEKENKGKMTWTIAMYATEAMAKDVGLSLNHYWEEIIKGCYLDFPDPVKKWKEVFSQIEKLKISLNKLDIRKLRVEAKDTDLIIGIDKNRKWIGCTGRNIPSYEIFISPDCNRTEGYISFSEPLYRYGNLVKGVKLEFQKGKVTKASAKEGLNILAEMIKTPGANKVGEFSLTDSRFSRITRFMGETLFDENVGGKYGNTHIALGKAYKDSYPSNQSNVSKKRWKEMGYNDSSVHTDIVSTTDRKVTAILSGGSKIIIYKDGKFTLNR